MKYYPPPVEKRSLSFGSSLIPNNQLMISFAIYTHLTAGDSVFFISSGNKE
jgi:hypothetical protein